MKWHKSVNCGCKINLRLKVTGKRADGFHELSSCFLFLPFPGDLLTVEDADTLTLECPGCPELENESNLVWRAAELFAAALRDQAKAILVGETTYGKSADQGVFELDNGSAVLLSNRSFQPPVSESFEEVGVVPDHNVQFDGKKIYLVSHEEDPQIAKALAVLSE